MSIVEPEMIKNFTWIYSQIKLDKKAKEAPTTLQTQTRNLQP